LLILGLEPIPNPDTKLPPLRSIVRQLELDPEQQGESRSNDLRVLLPLGIVFHVDESQQLVRVLRVWIFRLRR
jgi:hypothetical protein